ncbi:DUF4172 domain-containing protein [Roseateles sp. MS654]|uniref:DUF4172 domain-containing protein n=1 Tax=Roseateles sp. MS654 TaxID=3412685 RepID=UPI003C30D209
MTCSTTLKPWIWQHAAWPRFTYEARALESLLGEARIQHDRVARKLKESGACAGALAQAFFVDEAIATAAIEGERLPADAVRSAVARRFGGQPAICGVDRRIDGLVEMLTDASLNVDRPLDHARLCRWQAALFPNGISGLQRIAVGRYRDHEEPMQIVSGRPGREVVHYQAPAYGDGGFLGGLNAEKYMKMTGVSKATATRDLTDMAAAGQLRVHGAGKAARYYVEVPGWTHGIA